MAQLQRGDPQKTFILKRGEEEIESVLDYRTKAVIEAAMKAAEKEAEDASVEQAAGKE